MSEIILSEKPKKPISRNDVQHVKIAYDGIAKLRLASDLVSEQAAANCASEECSNFIAMATNKTEINLKCSQNE